MMKEIKCGAVARVSDCTANSNSPAQLAARAGGNCEGTEGTEDGHVPVDLKNVIGVDGVDRHEME